MSAVDRSGEYVTKVVLFAPHPDGASHRDGASHLASAPVLLKKYPPGSKVRLTHDEAVLALAQGTVHDPDPELTHQEAVRTIESTPSYWQDTKSRLDAAAARLAEAKAETLANCADGASPATRPANTTTNTT